MGNKNVKYKHTNESYQDKLDSLYDGQFKLISNFENDKEGIIVECLRCNHITKFSRSGIENQASDEKCPYCKRKNRENEIFDIISNMYDSIVVKNVGYVSPEKYNINYSCIKHGGSYNIFSKSVMYGQYLNKPLCPECQKEKNNLLRIERIKHQFPIIMSCGDVLNVLCCEMINNIIIIHCVDQDGYKYKFSNDRLSTIQGNGFKSELNKFFKRNPYTYDNINNYCKLHNIDLYIENNNYPISGYAREKLPFMNSKGEIIYTSWNAIQTSKLANRTDEEVIAIKNRMYMSKEKAIPIIKEMQKSLGRPLLQSDFEGVETTNDSIGIRVVWRLWGTFNNMIDEIGLIKHDAYYKPNDKNYVPHEDVIESIKIVCDKVKDSGRNTVMYSDFRKLSDIEINTIRRHCELENTTLNNIVKLHGCKLQKAGNGLNYTFADGEKIVSKYEYDFSNFLRDNGFIFNKNYFRDIKYKSLDNSYNGNMNCDYLLIFNNKKVYIELAGILGNKQQQEAYRMNIPIKSKSKELYRQKLNQKREIFERNKLDYYILLPDEMNEETYKNILNKYLKEVV